MCNGTHPAHKVKIERDWELVGLVSRMSRNKMFHTHFATEFVATKKPYVA